MKHDFNYPVTDTVKHLSGLPCECFDCMKDAAYKKQLHDRAAVYADSFDFNDLKIGATQLLGYATGNPVAVATAKASRQTKEVIKQSTGKTVAVDPATDVLKPGQVSVDWTGWFDWKIKLLLVAIIGFVLVSMYLRVTGK